MVPQPVKAVIMLFPITKATEEARRQEEIGLRAAGQCLPAGVWFTRQTVSNACGTVGVLHALGNADVPCAPGSFLDRFFTISHSMTPEERARLLESPKDDEPDLEHAHQNAAKAGQSAPPTDGEEVWQHQLHLKSRKSTSVVAIHRSESLCVSAQYSSHLFAGVAAFCLLCPCQWLAL